MTDIMPRLVQTLSTIEEYVPPVRALVHGTQFPGYQPARYYIMEGSSNDIRSEDWGTFAGCTDSGRLPKDYAEAALIDIDAERLDSMHRKLGYAGVHALGYAIGTTLMVGVMDRRSSFSLDPEDHGSYVAAGGVGKGAVHLTAGIWTPATRKLHVPHNGIKRGNKVSMSELPAHATLL